MFEVRDRMVAEGYITDFAKKVRWMRQDFFGCWDIIAIEPLKKQIRFIQVSANPWTKRELLYRAKLNAFPELPNCTREYWTKDQRGEWIIKFL
jgi:hypothetical protein